LALTACEQVKVAFRQTHWIPWEITVPGDFRRVQAAVLIFCSEAFDIAMQHHTELVQGSNNVGVAQARGLRSSRNSSIQNL
jgi:hypothetical protein